MKRIQQILQNKYFNECLTLNEQMEINRKFCRHGLNHLLDVARIAYIIWLEEEINTTDITNKETNNSIYVGKQSQDVNRELIYAAALLHDIGKFQQYKQKIPHEEASSIIAKDILKEVGFSELENHKIISAILTHRDYEQSRMKLLNRLIYEADKKSRNCYICQASYECNRELIKKNQEIFR